MSDFYQNTNETNTVNLTDSTVPPNGSSKGNGAPKNTFFKIFILIFACLIAIGGAGAAAYLAIPSFSNTVALYTLKPKDYYLHVEKKFLKTGADDFTSNLVKQQAYFINNKQSATEENFTLNVDKSITDPANLSELFPLELKIKSNLDMENFAQKNTTTLSVNQDSILTANTLVNLNGDDCGSTYIQIPELSDSYLVSKLSDALSNTDETSTNNYVLQYLTKYYEHYEQFLKDPISKTVLNSIITRYTSIALEGSNDVTLEKKSSVSANDVTTSNTKVIATYTGKDIYTILTQMLETAKEDTELKELFTSHDICDETQYSSTLDLLGAGLASVASQFNENEKLTITAWVDKNGTVTGHDFSFSDGGTTLGSLTLHTIRNGNDTNIECTISDDSTASFSLKGLNTTKDNVSNGTLQVALSEEEQNYTGTISYQDIQIVNSDKGYFNGTISCTTDAIPNSELKITATGTDTSQKLLFDCNYSNTSMGTLEFNLNQSNFEAFSVPPTGDIYNVSNADEFSAYQNSMNLSYIMELQEKYASIFSYISSFSSNTLFPSISSNDSNKTDSSTDDIFNENSDDVSDEDSDTTDSSLSTDENGLPSNAEVDEDGYYSFELTKEEAENYGAGSSDSSYYSYTIDEIKSIFEKRMEANFNTALTETDGSSYNTVNGSLDDRDNEYRYFVSTVSWENASSDPYRSIDIDYDTYTKNVLKFTLSVQSENEGLDIITDILSFSNDTLSKKDVTTLKAKIDKIKSSDNPVFTFKDSTIYYSVNDDTTAYITISPTE